MELGDIDKDKGKATQDTTAGQDKATTQDKAETTQDKAATRDKAETKYTAATQDKAATTKNTAATRDKAETKNTAAETTTPTTNNTTETPPPPTKNTTTETTTPPPTKNTTTKTPPPTPTPTKNTTTAAEATTPQMTARGDYGSTTSSANRSNANRSNANRSLAPGAPGSRSAPGDSATRTLLPSPSSACSSGRSTPVMTTSAQTSGEEGYEELFKDSMPCPTCRGLGRVNRDQESELVALIPMKDKRLKPRRTWLYVIIAILVCVLAAGTCMFFLFPRDVVISSNRPLLQPIFLDLNVSANFVNFTVMNFYNFTNSNFVPVQVVGAQMTAMYDERMMAKAINRTAVDVPLRASLQYAVLMNFVLSKDNDWGFLVSFCEDQRPWVHNLPITFELMANYTYLGHLEQTTLTTYQQVSCYNSTAHATVAPPGGKQR